MIIDAHNLFSSAQVVTADTISTNVIDLGLAGQNIGVGEDIYLVVSVQTLLDGAGDTLDVILVTDDNAAIASPTAILTLGTFPALSVAGTRFVVKLPIATYERYIALRYDPNGAGDLTAGAIDAFLTKDIAAFTAYADNITIS